MTQIYFYYCLPLSFVLFAAGNIFSQDDFRIAAVNEAVRNMDKSIFAAADSSVVAHYMSGGAPASMSSFVLFAGDETILFDAGLGGSNWVKKITELGVKPEKIKLILLTHMHGDHIGGLLDGDKRRFPNAEVRCSKPEYEYWLPENQKAKTNTLEQIKKAYGKDFGGQFVYNDVIEAAPAIKITALDAAGHTPGHTAFLIESPKKKFLIVGDLLHAVALQFPKPEICSSYDMDPEKTVASRKRILDTAAEKNIPIGGMHFPPPNIGSVKKDGSGYVLQ